MSSKDNFINGLCQEVKRAIREQCFYLADFFRVAGELFNREFACEAAFIDRRMKILSRVGFSVSPMQLIADHKSLDPNSCLTTALPLLKRQFVQVKPSVTSGKIRKIFHLSYPLSPTHDKPMYIVSFKFRSGQNPEGNALQECVEFLESQMYMYEIHAEESLFHQQYIESLQRVIESKSPRILEHCIRVQEHSKTIGALLKLNDLDMKTLSDAASIHDIGFVHVPNDILNKAGGLTSTEYLVVKKAVEEGYKILSSKNFLGLEHIAKVILSHMESFDGKGYPRGIAGTKIPKLSRVLAIANAYDAMTSPRPYQRSLQQHEALEELKRCSGLKFDAEKTRSSDARNQFDPEIVQKFVNFRAEWN